MDMPSDFPNSHVREAYLSPHVDPSTQEFEWSMPDLDGLRRFLFSMLGWDEKKVDGLVVPVIKEMNSRKVIALKDFCVNSYLSNWIVLHRLRRRRRLDTSLMFLSNNLFNSPLEEEHTRARGCRVLYNL